MAESKRMVCKLAAIGPDELRGVAAMAVGVYQWEGKGDPRFSDDDARWAELVAWVARSSGDGRVEGKGGPRCSDGDA